MNREPHDRGAATVAMVTFCFVFMAGGLIWLSRTVDQALHDRTNASAIALQAARAGAQELDEDAARLGVIQLDPERARRMAASTTRRLLAANGDTGDLIAVIIDGNRVTVTVTITTTGRPGTGTASASATAGFDSQGQ